MRQLHSSKMLSASIVVIVSMLAAIALFRRLGELTRFAFNNRSIFVPFIPGCVLLAILAFLLVKSQSRERAQSKVDGKKTQRTDDEFGA